MISAQETDVDLDDQALDLDKRHAEIVAGHWGAAYTRDWILYGLTEGTRVSQAYLHGRFPLGEDMEKCVKAFEIGPLRALGKKDREIQELRRRAYHRLRDFLLERHEYRAAWQVTKKFDYNVGESLWFKYRRFILWRVMAAAIAGDIAMNGSSPWRALLLATHSGITVCIASGLLIVVPAVLAECFQAPVHVFRKGKELITRLSIVWVNAAVIVCLLAICEWALSTFGCPGCEEWKKADNWKYHLLAASASQALGYAINLVWRDRSLAGPA